MALELGERFLPRPTTTFTKRRLYCCGERARVEVSVWSVCTGENPKNCQGSWMAGNDAVHAVMGSNRPRRRDLTCRRVDRTHPRVLHAGPSRSDGPAETPPVVQIPGEKHLSRFFRGDAGPATTRS